MIIGIVACEMSADMIGADLMRNLRQHMPNARFVGIGGQAMIDEGLECETGFEYIGSSGGVFRLLSLKTFRALRVRKHLMQHFTALKIDLFIGIDAYVFNGAIAKHLKEQYNCPTVQYASPSIWLWRRYRIQHLKHYIDQVYYFFKHERAPYRLARMNAFFAGHQLFRSIPLAYIPPKQYRLSAGFDDNHIHIGLLPGSKLYEIESLLAPALRSIQTVVNNATQTITIHVSIASSYLKPVITTIVQQFEGQCNIMMHDDVHHVVKLSDIVVVKAGTGALFPMLYKRPAIGIYQLSAFDGFIVRLLSFVARHFPIRGIIGRALANRARYILLPNLIARKTIMPAQLDRYNHQWVVEQLEHYMQSSNQELINQLQDVHQKLLDDALESPADKIKTLLHQK